MFIQIEDDYSRLEPTKEQIACNAIRTMFFHRAYNKRVPKKDIDIMLKSPAWHKSYGKKAVQDAWKHLVSDGYINGEYDTLNKQIIYIWGIEHSNKGT